MLAAENGHPVSWLGFARSRPRLRQYLPGIREDPQARIDALQQEAEALKAENQKLRAKLEKARTLEGKERTSALKIIAGMAVDKYGWHPRTPQPGAVKKILGGLQRTDFPVADNTLRKFLTQAAEEFGGS